MMNRKTALYSFVIVIFTAMMFSSCTMEKRHYRNGYYVQRVSVNINNHESSPRTATFPAKLALTDSSESVTYEDAHLTDASVRTVEKSTTDSSVTTSQRHTSPCESRYVSEKNITRVQLARPYSQPNLDDEPGEKKDRMKLATVLIIIGSVLLVGATIWFHPVMLLGPISLIVGCILLSRAKKGRVKTEDAKNVSEPITYKVKNAKPLWIASLIFLGLFLAFVVLAFTWEVLLVGVALSLPIALILAIVASIRERRNRKAYQSQSNSQPPKERFRKLKKVLKWVTISLTAILLVLIIGFIGSSGA
jgi:uncharacterized membrane protein (DUF485 family)